MNFVANALSAQAAVAMKPIDSARDPFITYPNFLRRGGSGVRGSIIDNLSKQLDTSKASIREELWPKLLAVHDPEIGGIGVIMLGLMIFSSILGGGMNLARAELTGPSLSRLGPNLQFTARRLWMIYSILTLLELGLLYYVGNMSFFDSVNYSQNLTLQT